MALFGIVGVQSPVSLSVSGEVAAGGEHLATVRAALGLLGVGPEAGTEAGAGGVREV